MGLWRAERLYELGSECPDTDEARCGVMVHGAGKLTYERCRRLLARLLAQMQDIWGDALLAVALFGSVARGEGGKTSDLDLLVVHRGRPEAMVHRFVGVLQELRQCPEYRDLTDQGFLPDPYPVFFTSDRMADHPWLLLDVLDHGIIIFDHEGILLKELDRLKERLRRLGARKVALPDGSWYWDLKPDWKPGEVVEL